jgi:hypothetical protein
MPFKGEEFSTINPPLLHLLNEELAYLAKQMIASVSAINTMIAICINHLMEILISLNQCL